MCYISACISFDCFTRVIAFLADSAESGYNVKVDDAPTGSRISLGGSSAAQASSSNLAVQDENHQSSPAPAAGRKLKEVPGALALTEGLGSAVPALHRRQLQQDTGPGWWEGISDEVLDGFRRGPQREACAQRAVAGWSFAYPSGLVDESKYRGMVAGHQLVDIIKEATDIINS